MVSLKIKYFKEWLPQILDTLSNANNESILQLKLGDSKKMFVYNIHIDLNLFPKDNLFYNNLISKIENNQGIVENFNLKSMEVLFLNNPKDMLNAIIDLIHQYYGLYAGFSYGTFISAVVGGNSRLEINLTTKVDFENGIQCFLNNDFATAKKYFHKVH